MILGFQQRFVPAVADGTKPHTIRAGNRWQVGMSIQFYQNVRQKSMRKIREDAVATIKKQVYELTIVRDKDTPNDTAAAIAMCSKGGLADMIASYKKELVLVNKRLKREKK